jgi:hypothetical protein
LEKLLEIAVSITDAYALAALVVIVLFLLFRGVLRKVGAQKGTQGFKIIMRLMSIVAGISILSLAFTFSIKAYEIYWINSGISASTIEELSSAKLTTEYDLRTYTGATLRVGNTGQGILLVNDVTLDSDYMSCSPYEEPRVGAPMVTYRYEVELTKQRDSKLLDNRQFKYGAGDVDEFRIDLDYPGYGVYKVWLTFNYKEFGSNEIHTFQTEKLVQRVCEKW